MGNNGQALDRLEATFGAVADCTRFGASGRRIVEEVVELAVELAREGREGRKVGTLFVIGDVQEVLERSRPLILDPLHGHPRELLHVSDPRFRETVKELALLDGAFIVGNDGVFVSAGRFVDVDLAAPENFFPGLGTRHAAAASITRATDSVAVVVSQSSIVRVFSDGELRAEVIPELFLMQREHLFTPAADVRQHPDAGVTVAVAGDR